MNHYNGMIIWIHYRIHRFIPLLSVDKTVVSIVTSLLCFFTGFIYLFSNVSEEYFSYEEVWDVNVAWRSPNSNTNHSNIEQVT